MRSALLRLPHTYRAFYGAFMALRPAQVAVVEPILSGRDVVLQAATGSGKTEAVLAPTLERVIAGGRAGSVLYVVPTRALAGDLLRRLQSPVCDRLGLRLAVRTGDLKRAGGTRPDILLTTPESLDVALGSSNSQLREFLSRTQTIIMDEAHVYAGQPRGEQLRFLLARLGRRAGEVQRVALSATLVDLQAIASSLGLRDAAQVLTPGGPELEAHLVQLDGEGDLVAFVNDLRDRSQRRKLLVFADSRRGCETLHSLLNSQSVFRGRCELHYSNLSSRERHAVEGRFRERRESVCIATSTLELGIDIGDVDAVLLYGPPATISAFLQRAGRAGRREGIRRVWGICHGELAGQQLLRFLGLIDAARRGGGEVLRQRSFPSVLVQQVLSCVYDKRLLSAESLIDLFQDHEEALGELLAVMQRRGWLRSDRLGMLGGGWRYHQALIERRIWSNFPPADEPFSLVVDEEVVASLPAAVVSQLEPGDRVQLTARRLRVLDIDPGERRIISAALTADPPTVEPSWVGMSAPVSFEAAQAVVPFLRGTEDPEGLFKRTRRLLQAERTRPRVTLANGLELHRLPSGGWYYWTHLGTFGNLVLREAVRRRLGPRLQLSSDALGISCEVLIDFQALVLPVGRTQFKTWVKRHQRLLKAATPLGAFSVALPAGQLIAELVTHLYDARLDEAFARLVSTPGTVTSGELAALVIPSAQPRRAQEAMTFDAAGEPMLTSLAAEGPPSPAEDLLAPTGPARSLTAGRFAAWIRLDQCARYVGWISRAPQPIADAVRLERDRAHRAGVIDALAEHHTVERISERHADGRRRSLPHRHQDTLRRMQALASALRDSPRSTAYVAHGVLMGVSADDSIVATPDLLELTLREDTIVVSPGDIRDSPTARYHHTWKVALCARYLAEILPDGFTLSERGFLLLAPLPGAAPRLVFALTPWLEAAPDALDEVQAALTADPAALSWSLGARCPTCPFFDRCYQQARQTHTVQLLPGLRPGQRQRLEALGIHQLEQLVLTEGEDLTDLRGSARALLDHRVTVVDGLLPYPPAELLGATSVEVAVDAVSRAPVALALQLPGAEPKRCEILTVEAAWASYLDRLEAALARPGSSGWLLHYGARSIGVLKQLGDHFTPQRWHALTRDPHTGARKIIDLRQLLLRHLNLPAPGVLSLAVAGRLLAVDPPLNEPPSPLHAMSEPADSPERRLQVIAAIVQQLQPLLRTTPPDGASLPPDGGRRQQAFLRFLERERVTRSDSILSLQQRPLTARMGRSRALGPLRSLGLFLDDEGQPLHRLRLEPGSDAAGDDPPVSNALASTRFREGDFLRLPRLGSADLQSGTPVILHALDPASGTVTLRVRGRGGQQITDGLHSLEEDLSNFGHTKLVDITRRILSDPTHALHRMLFTDDAPHTPAEHDWALQWLAGPGAAAGLDRWQARALSRAFERHTTVIEGPPGTGKTHLLGWILCAMLQRASEQRRPLRIAVTALTHKAIDHVLRKVVHLRSGVSAPQVRVVKLGRACEHPDADTTLDPLCSASEITASPLIVVGATGHGLTRLLGDCPAPFDLVACDEASQLLLPQAWLALIHGKGKALFVGDSQQLPPVTRSPTDRAEDSLSPRSSVLDHLLPVHGSVRLDRSYRLSDGLCRFPSRAWYDGALHPAPHNIGARLQTTGGSGGTLATILAPEPSSCLVLMPHRGRRERCPEEAELLAQLTAWLVDEGGVDPDRVAILSPHRAQNSLIRAALRERFGRRSLPVIDTVERLQGAERDVVLYGMTVSDPDRIGSTFITDPRRFNVAITRARLKLVVVGSEALFSATPHSEEELMARRHLLAFRRYCEAGGGLFHLDSTGSVRQRPAAG